MKKTASAFHSPRQMQTLCEPAFFSFLCPPGTQSVKASYPSQPYYRFLLKHSFSG